VEVGAAPGLAKPPKENVLLVDPELPNKEVAEEVVFPKTKDVLDAVEVVAGFVEPKEKVDADPMDPNMFWADAAGVSVGRLSFPDSSSTANGAGSASAFSTEKVLDGSKGLGVSISGVLSDGSGLRRLFSNVSTIGESTLMGSSLSGVTLVTCSLLLSVEESARILF
jgi:hypothetical protein